MPYKIISSTCTACTACEPVCPNVAIKEKNGTYIIDPKKCTECEGEDPQCVEVCPSYALEFMEPQFPQHMQRIHPDEKAKCMSERLQPLNPHKAQIAPEELFGGMK